MDHTIDSRGIVRKGGAVVAQVYRLNKPCENTNGLAMFMWKHKDGRHGYATTKAQAGKDAAAEGAAV